MLYLIKYEGHRDLSLTSSPVKTDSDKDAYTMKTFKLTIKTVLFRAEGERSWNKEM